MKLNHPAMCLWAVAAALTAGHAQAQAQSIKPGLWELRMTKQVVNGVDQTAQMAAAAEQMKAAMAKLTPEQRKQMEAAMGGAGAGPAGAHRLCISPAMAAQEAPKMPTDAKCQPPTVKREGNVTHYEFSCQQDGNTVKGKGQSEVASNRVVTRMEMVTTGRQGKQSMQSESEMRFVSADCGSVVPADQLGMKAPAKR